MQNRAAPTHLDLFSGIGGFALAAREAGFRTIGFCEIDAYCRKDLAKNFDCLSIYPDIRYLDGRRFLGVTLLTGGVPCQPASVAGQQRGAADDRWLWPETFRVIREARPVWVLLENVMGILTLDGGMEFDRLLSELESIGYSCIPFAVGACAVDAKHRRQRIWIIAHAERDGRAADSERGGTPAGAGEQPSGENHALDAAGTGGLPATGRDVGNPSEPGLQDWRGTQVGRPRAQSEPQRPSGGEGGTQASADSSGAGLEGCAEAGDPCREREKRDQLPWRRNRGGWYEWLPEPAVCRVVDGLPNRVDRIKALGNAICPAVAYEILTHIYALCQNVGDADPEHL